MSWVERQGEAEHLWNWHHCYNLTALTFILDSPPETCWCKEAGHRAQSGGVREGDSILVLQLVEEPGQGQELGVEVWRCGCQWQGKWGEGEALAQVYLHSACWW
jgi:hypothetical protein